MATVFPEIHKRQKNGNAKKQATAARSKSSRNNGTKRVRSHMHPWARTLRHMHTPTYNTHTYTMQMHSKIDIIHIHEIEIELERLDSVYMYMSADERSETWWNNDNDIVCIMPCAWCFIVRWACVRCAVSTQDSERTPSVAKNYTDVVVLWCALYVCMSIYVYVSKSMSLPPCLTSLRVCWYHIVGSYVLFSCTRIMHYIRTATTRIWYGIWWVRIAMWPQLPCCWMFPMHCTFVLIEWNAAYVATLTIR